MTVTAHTCHQVESGGDSLIEQFAAAAMCRFGDYNRVIGEAIRLEDLVLQLCIARDIMRKVDMGLLEPSSYEPPPVGMIEAVSSLIAQYKYML